MSLLACIVVLMRKRPANIMQEWQCTVVVAFSESVLSASPRSQSMVKNWREQFQIEGQAAVPIPGRCSNDVMAPHRPRHSSKPTMLEPVPQQRRVSGIPNSIRTELGLAIFGFERPGLSCLMRRHIGALTSLAGIKHKSND